MKKNIRLKVTLDMTYEALESVFITALEGGSNYWYWLSDNSISRIREKVSVEEDYCISTSIMKAVLRGAAVPIFDREDETNRLALLTEEWMISGLEKCAKEKPNLICDMLSENYDADTADQVFQYIVLHEIVFG